MSIYENDTQIQFRLPSSLKSTLMKRAKRQGINVSALLRSAILEYLDAHPEGAKELPEMDSKCDATYALRLPKYLKDHYLEVCELRNVVPSEDIRRYMEDTIDDYYITQTNVFEDP